jgi:hypothetical protein
MNENFILLNGDTLFQAPLVRQLLSSPDAPVTLAVDRKASYDEDDMKVCLDGTRLTDIGKKLPVDAVDGESIGCMVFRGDGPSIFARYLAQVLRDPGTLVSLRHPAHGARRHRRSHRADQRAYLVRGRLSSRSEARAGDGDRLAGRGVPGQ